LGIEIPNKFNSVNDALTKIDEMVSKGKVETDENFIEVRGWIIDNKDEGAGLFENIDN